MKRFASLATTAALAGSLLIAGNASQAASYNLYLVPTGATKNLALTTKSVSFRVLVDINDTNVTTLTIGPAIAVNTPNSVLRFTTTTAGVVAISSSFTPDKSQFQPAVDDFNNQGLDPAGAPPLWDQSAKINTATRTVGSQEVRYFQGGVGHTAYNLSTGGVAAIPAGTYTVGSYTIPLNTVAGGITNGSSVAFQLPSAFGLADPNNNTTQDFFTDNFSGNPSPTVSFPNNGTTKFSSLTYTFGTGTPATPAPSSLLVVAMGAVPMVGVLRRRSLKK